MGARTSGKIRVRVDCKLQGMGGEGSICIVIKEGREAPFFHEAFLGEDSRGG